MDLIQAMNFPLDLFKTSNKNESIDKTSENDDLVNKWMEYWQMQNKFNWFFHSMNVSKPAIYHRSPHKQYPLFFWFIALCGTKVYVAGISSSRCIN